MSWRAGPNDLDPRIRLVAEGMRLWEPTDAGETEMARYMDERGFSTYDELWRWSVEDLEGFWGALWERFDVQASQPYERVLAERAMPGAEWFPGARLNYAEHVLRDGAAGRSRDRPRGRGPRARRARPGTS